MLAQAPILSLLSGVDGYGVVLAGDNHFTTFINNFQQIVNILVPVQIRGDSDFLGFCSGIEYGHVVPACEIIHHVFQTLVPEHEHTFNPSRVEFRVNLLYGCLSGLLIVSEYLGWC